MKTKDVTSSFKFISNPNPRPPGSDVELKQISSTTTTTTCSTSGAITPTPAGESIEFNYETSSTLPTPAGELHTELSVHSVYNPLSRRFSTEESFQARLNQRLGLALDYFGPAVPAVESSPLRNGSVDNGHGHGHGQHEEDLFAPKNNKSNTKSKCKTFFTWLIIFGGITISFTGIALIVLLVLSTGQTDSQKNTAHKRVVLQTKIEPSSNSDNDTDDGMAAMITNAIAKQNISADTFTEFPIPDVKSRTAKEFKKEFLGIGNGSPLKDLHTLEYESSNTNTNVEGNGSNSKETFSNIFPLPSIANFSIVKEALIGSIEGLIQLEKTETRIHQLGLILKKRSPEAILQYQPYFGPPYQKLFEEQNEVLKNLSRIGYLMEKASKILSKILNLTKEETSQGIPVETNALDLNSLVALTGQGQYCQKKQSSKGCNGTAEYRTIDGSCNNLNHPTWGSTLQNYRRILLPDYGDGISSPRQSMDKSLLPNPKLVSYKLFSSISNKHHEPSAGDNNLASTSMLFPIWAEFVEYDLSSFVQSRGWNNSHISCCDNDTNLLDIQHPECAPISITPDDSFYSEIKEQRCMSIVRAAPAPTCIFGPREQYNENTGFLDGSTIYGSSELRTSILRGNPPAQPRLSKNGNLKSSRSASGKQLIVASVEGNDECNVEIEAAKGRYCFISGDDRVNDNIGLSALHIIWSKQHNFVADKLKHLNPKWDDEKLFQETRKIIIAQIQHITFK